jgi:protein TonB
MQSVSSNGVAHVEIGQSSAALAHGRAGTAREPLDAVLDMGRSASRFIFFTLLGAIVIHGAAIGRAEIIPMEMMDWSRAVGREVQYRIFTSYDVELLKPPEAPIPPPPEPEPVKEVPKEPPPPVAVKEVAPPAAPAAARAGAVLTAAPDPNAPANFDDVISGTGETFAGGSTSAAGTSDTAVRGRVVATGGVPGGTGTAATGPAAAVDRSRVASVAGSTQWSCPFPPEADSDQIDQAFPTIQVSVGPDGSPQHVTIVSDPGHGFGHAAVRCAMTQHFNTALDHDGHPIPGLTKSIRVTFER